MARRRGGGARDFPRTARVNELLREIIGETLERIDDERLELVSVTGVVVNPELTDAMVHFSSLGGEEDDAAILEAFADLRVRLQAAIGRQARLRRTPELRFAPDSGVRTGERVERLLATLESPGEGAVDGTGDDGA
ncbi:MAG: 30S ribosome-binding factor RbfA [Actinobacteria bacterium]|nr:30S ribosome-binding factor RbfA [Actinomycetota bacterium]